MNAPAKIGHNEGPAFNPDVLAELESKARDFADAAGAWKESGEIEDEAKAQKLNDFIVGCTRFGREIEDRRKLEKQPFLDAGRQVDEAFKKLTSILDRAQKMAKPMLAAWLQKRDEERRREQEELRRKAEAERKAAQEAEQAALARNDAAGLVEAEERAKAAEKTAKQAQKPARAQVASATGGGRTQSLRTIRKARITNINQAFLHYRGRQEIADVIEQIANAQIRAAKGAHIEIPGIEIIEEKTL